MKYCQYFIYILLSGDPGAVETALDGIVESISVMDLDYVDISVVNQSEVLDD